MANRPYPVITVNEKAARSSGRATPGSMGRRPPARTAPPKRRPVDVVSQKGRWLGTGLYNNHSKILVRLLSRNTNDRFDEASGGGGSGTPWTTGKPSWARTTPAAA